MKRVVCTVVVCLSLVVFPINIYAQEYNGSSESEDNNYDYKEYLPNEIIEILNKNNGQAIENIDVDFILNTVSEYLLFALSDISVYISELLCLILIFAVINKILDNYSGILIIKYIFILLIGRVIFSLFSDMYTDISSVLQSIAQTLELILPTYVTLLLMGGATLTSGTATTSFGTTVICLESVLAEVGLAMSVVTFIFIFFERISPVFESINCVKYLKKYTVMLITFICTVLMTALSFQTVLSARADSMSTRSVKFAAANFIPIVGNAVGESLRTVSQGIVYLRTSVSGAISLAIFFISFPLLTKLALLKILISACEFFASVCGIGNEKSILSSFLEVLDILLVIIICALVLSFLIIILFANTAVAM